MERPRRANRNGLIVLAAVLMAVSGIGLLVRDGLDRKAPPSEQRSPAGPPMTGVLTDTSQPVLGAGDAIEDPGGEPPAEIADGHLHATVNGTVLDEPLEDGAVIDRLGRDHDGRCKPAGSYGVAHEDRDGGPSPTVGFSLDEDHCTMVAHLSGDS